MKRILIIDDHLDSANALCRLLRSIGHDVHIELSGPAGLRAVHQLKPEIILLDLAMPQMSGQEVCMTVRSWDDHPRPLILAMSGFGSDLEHGKIEGAGFDGRLHKPLDFAELMNAIGYR